MCKQGLCFTHQGELGLRALLKLQQQAEIRAFRGRLNWEGDLESQRLDGESAQHLP